MEVFLVDAFASAPFTGNPAAICPLDGPAPDDWMQALAMEMNQAETAFLWPEQDAFRLRWFTPMVEVDLCGHATLAAAHLLWESERLPSGEEAAFLTRSGTLKCSQAGQAIRMDFPAETAAERTAPVDLVELLGSPATWYGSNRMDHLAILPDESAVRAVVPDMTAIAELECRGLVVTAVADPGRDYDFVSRFFAPQSGVPEDSVTGSAHCGLGPLWSQRLQKAALRGYQASRRGGYVDMEVRGDRVILGGHAVTTLHGHLTLAAYPPTLID
ncbi:MAG: putative isomerase YddE [Fimbriimonadaceae bacterium]|nr:putative isomerase YddE [Fimbriimonadaceae bacterium]